MIQNFGAHRIPEGAREHSSRSGRSSIGRNEIFIICPFCRVEVKAYLWSLAGSGKRCSCGALHTYYGYTRPAPEKKSRSKKPRKKPIP